MKFFVMSTLAFTFALAACGKNKEPTSPMPTYCEKLKTKLNTCDYGAFADYMVGCLEPNGEIETCQTNCIIDSDCTEVQKLFCGTATSTDPIGQCYNACDPIFTCDNATEVRTSWKCDGVDDCGDNSDEVGCATFTCADSTAIPADRECDGNIDCTDLSDEHNGCTGSWKCTDGTHSIPGAWLCDGWEDCSDSSDEADCPTFTCNDSTIISAAWECDGIDDCADFSDEHANCPNSLYCAP